MARRKNLTALAALGTLGYLLSKRGDKKDKEEDSKKDKEKEDLVASAVAKSVEPPDDRGASTADPSYRSALADAPRVKSRPVRTGGAAAKAMLPGVGRPQTDLQRARGTDDPRFRTAPVRTTQTDLQRARGTDDPRFRTDPRLNSRETPEEDIVDMTFKRGGSVKKASPAKGWGAARGGRSAKTY